MERLLGTRRQLEVTRSGRLNRRGVLVLGAVGAGSLGLAVDPNLFSFVARFLQKLELISSPSHLTSQEKDLSRAIKTYIDQGDVGKLKLTDLRDNYLPLISQIFTIGIGQQIGDAAIGTEVTKRARPGSISTSNISDATVANYPQAVANIDTKGQISFEFRSFTESDEPRYQYMKLESKQPCLQINPLVDIGSTYFQALLVRDQWLFRLSLGTNRPEIDEMNNLHPVTSLPDSTGELSTAVNGRATALDGFAVSFEGGNAPGYRAESTFNQLARNYITAATLVHFGLPYTLNLLGEPTVFQPDDLVKFQGLVGNMETSVLASLYRESRLVDLLGRISSRLLVVVNNRNALQDTTQERVGYLIQQLHCADNKAIDWENLRYHLPDISGGTYLPYPNVSSGRALGFDFRATCQN